MRPGISTQYRPYVRKTIIYRIIFVDQQFYRIYQENIAAVKLTSPANAGRLCGNNNDTPALMSC